MSSPRADIASVDDLQGSRVNFGAQGSGTFMTASIIFDELGVEVEPLAHPQQIALERLRDGDLEAIVFVDGAPLGLLEQVDPDEPFHLLDVPADRITGAYLPAQLTAEHYPRLIDRGAPVETVAIGEVLAAYNWRAGHPRREKLSRFIDRFFSDFDRLLDSAYHPKWHQVDLAAEVPGWRRLPSASEVLVASR